MSMESGRLLAHYRLIEKVGEGGMGVVWSAEDTKLGRQVAVKLLPDHFSRDAERLSRFEREARLLASLNHQNIAAIYGLEEVASLRFLVLELVPGESLAEILARGPLGTRDALGVCEQIALGLEMAHERGILHRDLKPANVKVTPDGQVKVLDFGLAKAVDSSGAAQDTSLSPTQTVGATLEGSILGTASYMSPEQARARPVDRRTDIWAFGCVLYEALTGQRAFGGDTISDIIARVIQVEPDWSLLPPGLPSSVKRLLVRCLQKDPDLRLRDAGDARLEIREALLAGPEEPGRLDRTEPARRRTARILGVAGALAAGVLLGWIGSRTMTSTRAPVSPPGPVRVEMTLPVEAPLAVGSFLCPVAISPAGDSLVYVGVEEGSRRLFLRDMAHLEVTRLPGTEGAEGPFFSPDGQWVGFHAEGKLQKISIRGGLPQKLLDLVDLRGADWGPEGTIVIAPGQDDNLYSIPETGGAPEKLTSFDEAGREWSHRFPQFLPGGKALIFSAHEGDFNVDDSPIWALSLETGERKRILDASTYVRYVPTGHLAYVQAGTLLAVPFDPVRLEVTGPARPLAQGIAVQTNTGAADFAVSANGTLVYLSGGTMGDEVQLGWVDRDGAFNVIGEGQTVYRWPSLSPDGKQLAIQMIGANTSGIWTTRTDQVSFSRLSRDGGGPVWSQDGQYVVYTQNRTLYRKRSDGSGEEQVVASGELLKSASSVSPDGSTVLFSQLTEGKNNDIWRVSTEPGSEPEPVLQTPAQEGGARFSPDGRHLAYVSDESGRFEVYVMEYPGPGGKWQVSTDGGREPSWSPDGRELFFRSGGSLMVASVRSEPVFRSGVPSVIVRGVYEGLLGSIDWPNYAVAPDGRVLMIKSPELEATRSEIDVVFNWFRELDQP